ncbi:NapC/NirT family cytochrome c [Inmirania thermothiophila]|uniref:Cytochrome c-type protein n=1 Tax=Inmirania thermothiophila TaxID=1750597 RepID=A0A3N1Y1G0_9GAMM|nr:NapC/NirT family cytochrome c [Inmirania thermothiophila]ROR32666.1 cytochrome c-type protein NapC [Inmirania thermothiophila]
MNIFFRRWKLRPWVVPSVLTLVAVGAVYGAVYYPLVEGTNSMAFCISCHEMRTPYEEYKESLHYRNPSGVRAECPDCHVPQAFVPKLAAKIRAAKDVWFTLTGKIDTPEKFRAHRLEMAERVWWFMERTDSATCRSCHQWDGMDLGEQDRQARRKHETAQERGKTCIHCHRGVVHRLPERDEPDEQGGEEEAAT